MIIAGAPDVPTLHAEAPDGVLVAYRRFAGERATDAADAAPPVLLVHGFATTARVTWEGTGWVRALQAAGRDVIVTDLRGHGDSDKPVDAASYGRDRLGDDLVAVLDSAGVEVVDAVGYSLGGRIVSALTGRASGRVRRVVIGGAGPSELFATWDPEEARGLLLRGAPPRNPVIAQVLRPALESGADREALLACIEGIAGAPLELPSELAALFVVGELDPVPAGVEQLARDRGSDVITVPGRDHVSTLTSRTFKDAAIGFLAG
ncbi:alpha/beta fold hydrolase [Agromyces sp. G08B096]|uniref:Alpha/beta fold hydrolase n=1 Tax=Agromyces sp. G08B096 TaxID=3156399 RepID=A0AAU7W7I4_9MICO